MKLFALLTLFLMSTTAFSIECKGDVEIPNTEFKSFAYISFDDVEAGKIIELGSPILSDVTISMAFKIVSVQVLPSFGDYLVREVIAVSTNTGSGSVMIFNHVLSASTGEVFISDFKGFEAELAYGPSRLTCQ